MMPLFPLAPRYRLDDESPWLEGIDPLRNYWLRVNGDISLSVVIPGLAISSVEEFKFALRRFRSLQPGEQMQIGGFSGSSLIHCISQNCYAIESTVRGAEVWHLFDQETLDSLLMTSHPDWQCAPQDVELGRRLLAQSWTQQIAA